MSNGTYKRTTSASRRAERVVKYKFVSARVTPRGTSVPGRTPRGEGKTYRKTAE
jgi:hypothetical protein